MSDGKNDPQAFMFTCDGCGAWPMAFEAEYADGAEISYRFACPRCRAHGVKAKRRGIALQARRAIAG